MAAQYKFLVLRKYRVTLGPDYVHRPEWVCNPIGSDRVISWRAREVTPWEVRQGEPPEHVLKAVGVRKDEDGWHTRATGEY